MRHHRFRIYDRKHQALSLPFSLDQQKATFIEPNQYTYSLDLSVVFSSPRFCWMQSTESMNFEFYEIFEGDLLEKENEEYVVRYSPHHGGFVGQQVNGAKEWPLLSLLDEFHVKGHEFSQNPIQPI